MCSDSFGDSRSTGSRKGVGATAIYEYSTEEAITISI